MIEEDIKEKVLELNLEKYTSLEKVLEDKELGKDDQIKSNYSEIQELESEQKVLNELLGSTDPKIKKILENAGIEIEQFGTGKQSEDTKNPTEIFKVNLKVNGAVIATLNEENGVWIHGGHAGIGFESIVRRIENIRNEMNTLERATSVARYQYAMRELMEFNGKDKLSIAERVRRRNLKRKIEKLSTDPEVSRYLHLQKQNPNLTQEAVDNLKKTCEDIKVVGKEHMTAEERAKAIEKELKNKKKEILDKSVSRGYFELLETYDKYKNREDLKNLPKSVKEMILEGLPSRGYEPLRKDFDRYYNAYTLGMGLAREEGFDFGRLDARMRHNYFRFGLEMQRILGFGHTREHFEKFSKEMYEARMRIFDRFGKITRPFESITLEMKRDMFRLFTKAQDLTKSFMPSKQMSFGMSLTR